MGLSEFELIERFFRRPPRRAVMGPGDDCAIVAPSVGMQLAVSTDMLVEGRHFLPTVPPDSLGHKALAVNLSDLAACGARPLGMTLALSLPSADTVWLERFAQGLLTLADRHACELIGGDTTAGPLNVCITVLGEVPQHGALLRSGARAGDDIWVSGCLGDARLALEIIRGHPASLGLDLHACRHAMERPTPRVELGLALREIAHAAIDVSDGLMGDLTHLLRSSRVNALVHADALPLSPLLAAQANTLKRLCALSGGDDYELLFTAAPQAQTQILAAGRQAGVMLSRIGTIEAPTTTAGGQLRLVDAHGAPVSGPWLSFDHFRSP